MEQVFLKTFRSYGVPGVIHLGAEFFTVKTRPAKMPILPTSLQVEPTIRCNLKCVMCDRTFWNRTAPDMNINEFMMILDQFSYLRNLQIQGLGEPLLHPQIADFIAYAKSKNIVNVDLITNGTVLTEQVGQKLIDAGLGHMGISVDSPIASQYEEIRPGAKFEKVIGNIKRFVEINRGKIDLVVGMTCGIDTVDQAPELMDLVHEVGVKNFALKGIHLWGKDFWEGRIGSNRLQNDIRKARQVLETLEKKAKVYNMNLSSSFIKEARDDKGSSCLWPWTSAYVTVDCFVTPCCIHGTDPRKFNFGNLKEKSFREIWNSPAYQDFRVKLKSPAPDKFCNGCPEL